MWGEGSVSVACCRESSCVAFALHYCIGLAHPTNLSSNLFISLRLEF
ncbi:hypothetical protein LINGRAHAP2_LOCUS35692 [Linum grandiflorum]